MKSLAPLILLLFVAGLAPPASAQSALDGVKCFFGCKEEAKAGDGIVFDEANDDKAPCGGEGRTTFKNALVEQGLGVVEDPDLNSYLNAIAAMLVATSKRPHCRITVWVTPHDAPQGLALADGGVLVTMGFLRNLKNEDEVAAILAHEVSHVLQNHHASDSFVGTQDKFLKGLDAANAAGSVLARFVDPRLSQGLQDASLVSGLAYNVSEGLIAPAFTREQEDEADRLGTDLLARAGYNPSAMAAIMDIVKTQEAELAKVEAERDRLRQERLGAAALEAVAQSATGDLISVARGIAKLATVAVQNSSAKAKAEHRPAEERQSGLNDYVRTHYRKERRRNYEEQAWRTIRATAPTAETFLRYRQAAEARRLIYAQGDVREAQTMAEESVLGRFGTRPYPRLALSEVQARKGEREDALISLAVVIDAPDTPWHIYRSASELHLAADETHAAGAIVTRADEALGRPLGIAPYAIKVFRQLNDQARVQEYLARCDSEGTRAHLAACLDEAGMTNDQYQLTRLVTRPLGGFGGARDADSAVNSFQEPSNQ